MKDSFIQTYTGEKFYPFNPKPEQVHLEDIAHALSHICRYGGAVEKFYSVAQHCVLAARYCDGHQRWLLMHDAAEAYIGDMIHPIKEFIPEFRAMEEKILDVITERFGLPNRFLVWESVQRADLLLASTEKRDLLSVDVHWDRNLPVPMDGKIIPWTSEVAKEQFFQMAKQLWIKEI